jgi:membrane-associated phospholipid phosphatase
MLVVLVAPVRAQEAPDTPPPIVSESAATLDLSSLPPLTPAPDLAAAALDRPAGDGRRTLSAFPLNVARGVIGVFSRDSLVPFAIGSGLALAGHSLDGRVESSLQGSCISCGSAGSTAGGVAVVPVVGALFLAGRFAPQGAFRAVSYDFAQAVVVNAVWTGALKYSLHRQRPDGSDYYSLPSGHTSTAFSLATVAEQHFGWKVGVPAYLLASGIGLSRIESNKHYLSDVIAGAAIGVIVGRTVTRVDGAPGAKHKTLSLYPATDPHGAGVGVGMSASW